MEDCYFFLFSSCLKGSTCPFRHQESCKSNGITCKNWQSALGCTDPECSFRHSLYHLQKPRSLIPCYWEENSFAGGCKKPDCPFMHRLKKDLVGSGSSVDGYASNSAVHSTNLHSVQSSNTFPSASQSKSFLPSSNSSTATKKPLAPTSSSHSIDRLAFKRRKETVELKKNPTQASPTDFQVKSLEQIMREKHAGSAGESKSASISNPNPKIESKSIVSNTVPLPNTQPRNSPKQSTPINNHLCLLEDIDKELEEMNKLLS